MGSDDQVTIALRFALFRHRCLLVALTLLMTEASLGAEARSPRLADPVPDPGTATHYLGATEVFRGYFTSPNDDEIYGLPAGWTRRQGPGYPRYIRVRIVEDRPPPGGRALQVDLNGAAAAVLGPPVSVEANVLYVLEGYVKTAGLRHDEAYLTLAFVDSKRRKLASWRSDPVRGSTAWQKVVLGPLRPPQEAASLLVGVHLEPQGEMFDLRGSAAFGGIWVGRVPQLLLSVQPAAMTDAASRPGSLPSRESTASPGQTAFLVFPRGQDIEIASSASGVAVPKYKIRFDLEDHGGARLAHHEESFESSADPTGKAAIAHWRLPNTAVGFRRVRACVIGDDAAVPNSSQTSELRLAAAEMCFVVVEPQTLPSESEFGWSLDREDPALGLAPLGDLLGQSGIRWVKFPFVCKTPVRPQDAAKSTPESPTDGEQAAVVAARGEDDLEPLIRFSDRIGDAGLRMAGVIYPPAVSVEETRTSYGLLAIEAFAGEPGSWYPSIEPVLARLANEIRYWQLGDDRDPGWIGCLDLTGVISRAKAELDRIGQELELGIAWNLRAPLPIIPANTARRPAAKTAVAETIRPPRTPWRFLTMPCDDSASDADLARRLDETQSAGVARWIVLDALPRQGHTVEARAAHLANRMLTAKIHGAEGIFYSRPIDSDRGLFDRNGSASELFLPWRTAALMLGGARYDGDIDLPHGQRIHCFAGKDRHVGVLPAGAPSEEAVYLGDKLVETDLWGNSVPRPPAVSTNAATETEQAAQSSLSIKRLPTFLIGLDPAVVRWQLAAGFTPSKIPSVPSAIERISLQLTNTMPSAITGKVRIAGPRNWSIEPRTAEFRLEPGAEWKQRLEVALPNDVVGGRQMVRLDFEIQAGRFYRFAMHRPLEVTLGDVEIEGKTLVGPNGQLEVRQILANRGKKPVEFRCDLLAPDRRRQSSEVLVLPNGRNEAVYRLPDGEQLLGKAIWLRAEEMGGPRVLNLRVDVPMRP